MSTIQGQRRYSEMFRLGPTPTIVARGLHTAPVALTYLRCEHAFHGKTAVYEPEATFMVSLQLRGLPSHELCRNGRHFPIEGYSENTVTIYDLRERWQANLVDPFEVVHLHIPMTGLVALASECGSPRPEILTSSPKRGKVDETLRHLVEALLPSLAGSRQDHRLYSEHVLLAMREHVASHYGTLRPAKSLLRGSLSPFQTRRAQEYLRERMSENVSLEEVASECHLSVSHFTRGFKRATGLAPHQWLMRTRLEHALVLLCQDLSLADVALACGFADQAHFTRVFTQIHGISPGRWRRERH
jgi:AraC family transcriptional regulator